MLGAGHPGSPLQHTRSTHNFFNGPHEILENLAFPKFGGCSIYGFAPKRSGVNRVFLL